MLVVNYCPAGALQQRKGLAEPYLHNAQVSLADSCVSIQTAVVAGSVAETIIDYADEHQVDLIVMASHGRSGLSRWLYGSIAEKVLHGANCATLVIPKKEFYHGT